ncbi:MAG: hypothetical protein QXV35_00745 [Archaeoglobaceae archaeon]
MIVIDASALAALILKESYWKEILNSSDLFVLTRFFSARKRILSRRIDREQSLEALNILMEFAESNIILKPSKEILSRGFSNRPKREYNRLRCQLYRSCGKRKAPSAHPGQKTDRGCHKAWNPR